ncbi:hypothetical protein Hanom_Chr04g00348791 [Helianthus anomalus]
MKGLIICKKTVLHCRAITDKKDCEVEMANHEDDCTFDIDNIASELALLNNLIEDATNSKKILASRLDRAISLKRKVELNEKVAEEAKVEAAKSSLDILAKVEALKQAQQLLKETNDMVHARELHAQKAVLAKDLKELQLRMSGILNQGRRSLGAYDVMRNVLKTRLTTAVREKELADKEKLEKENLALEALAFEESQMLKLENESNRLKQEAVKTSKLQDLFKDRESVVNMIHAEASDKHQDINLFIERLDQPLLKLQGLLSSSQTSADLDLEEQEGKKNGSFEVKSAPVFADVTEVGHLVSNKSSVASAQTHAKRVVLRAVKPAVKKMKAKPKPAVKKMKAKPKPCPTKRKIASAGKILSSHIWTDTDLYSHLIPDVD